MLEWPVILTVLRKDLAEWRHQPRLIFVTLLPAVGLFVLMIFLAVAVGRNKVALVIQDSGPHTQQLVDTIKGFDAFIVTETAPDSAAQQLVSLQVEAIITIPQGFEAAYTARQPDPVTIQINNLNLDFTNDLRRSLPAAITDFYAQQPDNPIRVDVQETDLRQHDIGLLEFQSVSLIVMLLTLAGVINTGLAVTREWEEQTIKELMLAPVNRASLIVGKILAGWIITLVFGLFLVGLGVITGRFQPQGWYWLTALLTIALTGLMSVGLGVMLASLLRREELVFPASFTITFYLYFLSGGGAVIAFLPAWVRAIAQFIPTYYGVHALQMAVFYNSTDLLARDLLVMVGTTIVVVFLAVIALRRRVLV